MCDLLGSWRANKDFSVRVGISAFTLPMNSIVAVTQVDTDNKKVLVEIGPACVDWFSKSWIINNFQPCA